MFNSIVRSLFAFALFAGVFAVSAPPTFAEEQETKITMPATAAEIWKAVDQHMVQLKTVVASGKLDQVHTHAYAVRDLIRALPDHSPGLSPDALAKVRSNIPFVDTLATRLDQAGDAGDKPNTEANVTKLEAILKNIRSQYAAAQ